VLTACCFSIATKAIILAAKEHKVMVFVVDNPPAQYYLHKFCVHDHYKHHDLVFLGCQDDRLVAIEKQQAVNTVLFKDIDGSIALLYGNCEPFQGRRVGNAGDLFCRRKRRPLCGRRLRLKSSHRERSSVLKIGR